MHPFKKTLTTLKKLYPGIEPALDYSNPFDLAIATILSAQCTDKRVNEVTQTLFKKYRRAEDYLNVATSELEQDIHSTGFYKNKTKNIRGFCKMLIQDFKGVVPQTMEELLMLPGVGRKTANVILTNGFGKIEGLCVDTHVTRLAQRLGLSKSKDAIKIEQDLMKLAPKKEWPHITHALIWHGRNVCLARTPRCELCPITAQCNYFKNPQ